MLAVNIREKRYASSREPVLADLELCLHSGEFCALIGPSGAGKSTLLQLISGLDTDYSGDIRIDDQQGQAARLSYMFQDARLMPWLTALENVALVASGNVELALAALQSVGLQAEANQYPGQLSGGMQRRVALARAFAHQPQLLLMDEPFVSLDQPSAEKMRQLLLAMWQRDQPGVLFVSHNLDEAIALADRLVFLSPGPARVVLDVPVPIPRPRQMAPEALVRFRDELLSAHPDILTGSASS